MDSRKLTIDLFLKHPGFPVAVVPVNLREPAEPDYTFVSHYHDFQELVVITSGSGIQRINGTDYPVSAGDVFLLQGKDEHCFVPAGNSLGLYNILYDQDNLPLPLGLFHKIGSYNMIFRVEPALRKNQNFISHIHLDAPRLADLNRHIKSLQAVLDGGEEGFEVESVTLLASLILNLCRNCRANSAENGKTVLAERMNKVISLMEKNFAHHYSVAELARSMHTSPRNFSRLFHKVTGSSPIEYLLKVRLRHAAELLISADISCADAAWQSGFADSNYFSRKFSEQYGLSPREYRKYNRESLKKQRFLL